jgi:hypothetical protein
MQVTSLELSKKLEELGITKHSTFKYGVFFEDNIILSANIIEKKLYSNLEAYSLKEVYPAYSLDEILELLPNIIFDGKESPKTPYELYMRKWQEIEGCGFGFSYVYFQSCFKSEIFIGFHDKNPAEAAGQLLVWCIENGYVEIKK